MLTRYLRDAFRDPVLPVLCGFVLVCALIMLAQTGVFGSACQWIFRPEAVQ